MPNEEKSTELSSKYVIGEAIDKAAAEIVQAAVGRTADGLLDFGSNLFSAIIGDRVREWRVRNLVQGAKKQQTSLRKWELSFQKQMHCQWAMYIEYSMQCLMKMIRIYKIFGPDYWHAK